MAYRPGTLDDASVIRRELSRRARRTSEANTPGKTQTFQTTAKVGGFAARITQAENNAAEAKQLATLAESTAIDAIQATNTLTDRVATGEGRLTALETDVAGLDDTVAAHGGDITDIQRRLAELAEDNSIVYSSATPDSAGKVPIGTVTPVKPRANDLIITADGALRRVETADDSEATVSERLASLVGPKGDRGADGKDGASISIHGSYDTLADLQADHPTGQAGDGWLVGGDLYVWDATTSAWLDVGTIKGPKGDKGDKGDQGDPGRAGQDGKDGQNGQDGKDGQDGTAAGFGVPTAQMVQPAGVVPSVSVTATGPDTAKVFAFQFSGLKGDQGDKGEKGDTGDTGPQGPQGESAAVVTLTATGTGSATLTIPAKTGYTTCACLVTVTATGTKAFTVTVTANTTTTAAIPACPTGLPALYPGGYDGQYALAASTAATIPTGKTVKALASDSTAAVTVSVFAIYCKEE